MRKIISYLIAVSMVITMVPAAVFAAEPADQTTDQQPAAVTEDLGSDEALAAEEDLALDEGATLDLDENDLEGDAPQTGWQSIEVGGVTYWQFFENGAPVKGLRTIGYDYYFDETDGYMQVGWQTISGDKYYFTETKDGTPGDAGVTYGSKKTGMQVIGGSTYYFGTDGKMKTAWQTIGGAKYYFGTDGKMQTGLKTISGFKYYFGTDGKMQTGKKKIGDYWYYFNSNGKMRTGWLAEGKYKYYYAENGHMKTGLVKIGSDKYYFDGNGRMQTGKKTISGSTYYFDTNNGKMRTGFVAVGSAKYYYSPSTGKLQKGWLTVGSNKYYLDPSSGKMWTGMKKVGKSYYYFNTSNGKMTKNAAVKYKKKLYYFYSSGKRTTNKGWFKGSDKKSRYGLGNGVVATGKKTISGITYKFSTKTGICLKNLGDVYDQKIAKTASSTKYLIYVVKSKHQVRIYKGKKKNWTRIYTFTCALGKPATPTPSGTFTIKSKTAHHNYKLNGLDVHWNNGLNTSGTKYGFNGYVWSGVYPDGTIIDSSLGGNTSGGRIRIAENYSLWMYNNIPVKTKVIIK